MRRWLPVALVVACFGLVGCQQKIPAATQPKLEGVRLVGRQLCGNLTTGGQTFSFACTPLPTIGDTGWVLSPPYTPSIADPNRQHLNKTVTVTVSAPSLTEIDVELVRLGGAANAKLTAVDPNLPGKPGEVAASKEVGVVSQDSGNGKTWNIDVNISGCADFREIQIFNRSNNARSNPVSVWLLRDPAEEVCVGGGGGGVFFGTSGGTGHGQTNPKPTGPCAGGAAEQLFNVCENCGSPHDPKLNVYTGFSACNWNDVLAVFGYTGPASTKAQICTIQQVASRAACEGPP